MTIFDQEHRPPEADEIDTVYATVRAVAGGIPFLGDVAQELLDKTIGSPLA